MSRIYDCADESARKDGISDAASAVRRGDLVVLPTDTVYGIGTDAFSPNAVAGLLAAKGRGREMPPPVLVGSVRAANALVGDLGDHGRELMEEFWPGPLTLVFTAAPSLSWDLGDTKGTVAVRMPMDPVTVELLRETGPMAVSSANKSGQPAAARVEEAIEQFGDQEVAVYLDGGQSDTPMASTIVDLTYAVPRVLRSGAVTLDQLRAVCGTVIGELRKPRRKPEQTEEPQEAEQAQQPERTQAAAGDTEEVLGGTGAEGTGKAAEGTEKDPEGGTEGEEPGQRVPAAERERTARAPEAEQSRNGDRSEN